MTKTVESRKSYDNGQFFSSLNKFKFNKHDLHNNFLRFFQCITNCRFVRFKNLFVHPFGTFVTKSFRNLSHIFRETISNIEQKLNPHKFSRIYRTTVFNLDFVRELQALFRGDYQVILQDGKQLMLSRRYRKNLTQHCGGSF